MAKAALLILLLPLAACISATPPTAAPAVEVAVGSPVGSNVIAEPSETPTAEPTEDGLWWNQGSDELLVFGTSLPVSPTDPLRGKQMHWIRNDEDGVSFRSIYETAVPGNSIAWMMPISGLDTLFLRTQEGLFMFQEDTFSSYDAPELLNSAEANGRIIDFIPGRIEFPGEISCRDEREAPLISTTLEPTPPIS